MKRHLLLALLSSAALLGNLAWAASDREDATDRLNKSAEVLKDVAAAPGKGIPDEVVEHAKCIVVVPDLMKAGLVLGGKYGRGVAVCRTDATAKSAHSAAPGWSAPAFVMIGGASWGLQIGAEGIDLVMVVMNDNGLQQLLTSKVEFSLEGSAAAGPVGRHAAVGSDSTLNSEILTYSRTKGVFAGQTLEGAVIKQDDDSTKAIYGSDQPFNQILTGKVAAPAPAASFLRAVAEISREARQQQARQQVPTDRNNK